MIIGAWNGLEPCPMVSVGINGVVPPIYAAVSFSLLYM
jgi:hypothetical protein